MWGSDMTPDYTPFEAGLDRFVRLNKGCLHRQGGAREATRQRRPEPLRHLRSARRHRCRPARQRAAVRQSGKIVGRATAGYYGHTLRKSLGSATSKPEFAAVGTELEIEILGERKRATVWSIPYDPENKDLRA
jgi:dimethylglycine dehydrogenase